MSDPITDYFINQIILTFKESLRTATASAFDLGQGNPTILAKVTNELMNTLVHVLILTTPSASVDRENDEVVGKYGAYLTFKYLTLIAREIDPQSFEEFKKTSPDLATIIEEKLRTYQGPRV